jgi:hypothetical protein
VRLADRESGLSARTIGRSLSQRSEACTARQARSKTSPIVSLSSGTVGLPYLSQIEGEHPVRIYAEVDGV